MAIGSSNDNGKDASLDDKPSVIAKDASVAALVKEVADEDEAEEHAKTTFKDGTLSAVNADSSLTAQEGKDDIVKLAVTQLYEDDVDEAGKDGIKARDDANEDDNVEDDKVEGDLDQTESSRRKRDREGSLEPSLTPSRMESIPTKKNRRQSDSVTEDPSDSAPMGTSPPRTSNVEGEKVGQIRKRVQDLSWKQRKEGHRDRVDEEDEDDEEDEAARESLSASIAAPEAGAAANGSGKVGQASFASFSKSTGLGAAKAKGDGSFLDRSVSPSDSGSAGKSPSQSSARTQPTFSSFSKSSSPFNAASVSVAGPSWLAGKPGASGVASGGGMRPSSLGTVADDGSQPEQPIVSPTASPPPPPKQSGASSGKGLGFGAFAASNPFASKSSTGSRNSSPFSGSVKVSDGDGEGPTASEGTDAGEGNSFDEALRRGETAPSIAAEHANGRLQQHKVQTQLDRGEADLRTGEEDETSVASVRAKLYILAENQSWKERGTGTVRCNVPKDARNGKGARLLMRAEGVLRLILNVKLFKGMSVSLEQEKFLRINALDNGKPVNYALRIGNAAAASQFYRTIRSNIPVDTNAAESLA